jgi:hypothetical protein
MFSRSKAHILILILALITLSACGPDLGVLPPDPDGDDSGEDVEVSGPQVTDIVEDGTASVHYHYLMNDPDLEFKIEPVLPLDIDQGDTPGRFDVTGIGETRVQMRMAADGGGYRCNVHCDVILRFTAVGEIQLDDSGACIIPMSFQFQPQADEWILETDCPEELAAVIDCAAFSMVMADPSVYTFTNSKRDVILPSESGVTLRAEIKNVIMPRDTEGICNW